MKTSKTLIEKSRKEREKNIVSESPKKFKKIINEIKNKDIRDSLSQLIKVAEKWLDQI